MIHNAQPSPGLRTATPWNTSPRRLQAFTPAELPLSISGASGCRTSQVPDLWFVLSCFSQVPRCVVRDCVFRIWVASVFLLFEGEKNGEVWMLSGRTHSFTAASVSPGADPGSPAGCGGLDRSGFGATWSGSSVGENVKTCSCRHSAGCEPVRFSGEDRLLRKKSPARWTLCNIKPFL